MFKLYKFRFGTTLMLVISAITLSIPVSSPAQAAACGTVNIADNAWVGYEANLAVVSYVLKKNLGCKVVVKNLSEQVSWQGFPTGQVDVILENWGHEELAAKYITKEKTAVDLGSTGNNGIIGWYVAPWMVAKYPGITSYVTNDAAIVKNLKLNYKVIFTGSEAALITSFRAAEKQKKPMIGYFYEPQWFLAEVPLAHVTLPAWTKGCDADPKTVACDYPPYPLNKVASTKFVNSGSPAVTVIKNFKWTNADQNSVAKSLAFSHLSDDAAAKIWVDAHPAIVKAWLGK